MNQMQMTPAGTVVPFRSPDGKYRRRVISDGESRGAILLFTGVRYERQIGDGPLMALPRPPSGTGQSA
jgi:hypothetical protein